MPNLPTSKPSFRALRFDVVRGVLWGLLVLAGLATLACGGETAEAPPSSAEAAAPEADSPPPAAAPLGSSSIAGKIVFDGDVPNLKPISMDADPGCAAKHDAPVAPRFLVLGEGQSLANVFVQVKNAPVSEYPTPAEPTVLDQRGCIYDPRVAGVMVGQKLLVKNSDGLLHNVRGLPKENREFNIGMPGVITEAEQVFNKPEPIFKIKCDVHPWMATYVAVMTHPYFAVSSESGEFRIEGLPAGDYEIEAWHERLGTQTASLTVGDGETARADLTFSPPNQG